MNFTTQLLITGQDGVGITGLDLDLPVLALVLVHQQAQVQAQAQHQQVRVHRARLAPVLAQVLLDNYG